MTVRETALRLLERWEAGEQYINLTLRSHLTDALSPSERAFLTALLYTAVERKITLDYRIGVLSGRSLDSIDPTTKNILRLGLCQISYFEKLPDYAAVSETVALARNPGEKAFVNAVLRAAVRGKDSLPLPDRKKNLARFLSVAYSMPTDKVKRFLSLFGESETEALLASFNETKPTTVAVNLTRISRDEWVGKVRESGIRVEKTAHSPLGARILDPLPIREIPGFDAGEFYVQDEASQLAALALGVKPGDRIADVCAAPGGKTFAAAILSGNGEVDSFDLHESKLSLIRDGAERLGLSGVKVAMRDATGKNEDRETYDAVLCDVPCSGLAVLGKKPDLRYKPLDDLSHLPEIGRAILDATADLVKPGGTLVFSTCTLLPEENEEVFHAFLASHGGFSPVDFSFGRLSSAGGALTVLPHKDGMDGFFIAKMRKQNDQSKH